MKIALIGNPNSGKTTLFNKLTKSNQKVGNFTGVTVEKKSGKFYKDKTVEIIDLPGVYSLMPYSLEESVTCQQLENGGFDCVINIVDSTNLERNLQLTLEILSKKMPTVIALNMCDELEKNGVKLNVEEIEKELDCQCVLISALKGKGLVELIEKAKIAKTPNFNLETIMVKQVNKLQQVGLDVGENENNPALLLAEIGPDENTQAEKNLIAKKEKGKKTKYVTLLNETKKRSANAGATQAISAGISENAQQAQDRRVEFIKSKINSFRVKGPSKSKILTEKIDKVLLNKWLAFPIFLVVIFLMYFISIQTIGKYAVDLMEVLFSEIIGENLRVALTNGNVATWLISLLVDGIVAGVGGVLSFVPQIIILFFIITTLECTGYMARVALIMDRLFKKIGLSGKSFIPMIIGCGCSVPAIMACKTIENNFDRKSTILLTPFIPCSAKLPVFALIAGVMFPANPFVAPSMYFLGILMVIICGFIIKKMQNKKAIADTFILEIPRYRVPSGKVLAKEVYNKSIGFVQKAGTIIFISSILIWFLQSFNFAMKMVDTESSMLASIGKVIAPLFVPLGFGNWQASVSLIAGLFAKETILSTFLVLFSEGGVDAGLLQIFTPQAGYAFMAFILISAPCIAGISATKKELGFKWMFIALAFQTGVAYALALIINQCCNLYNLNKGVFLTVALSLLVLVIATFSVVHIVKGKHCTSCSSCSKCKKTKKL